MNITLMRIISFSKICASQAFNLATGNFVGLVCNSINYVDELHQIEKDAEDDPLGSARTVINRYSSSDPFYGIHNQDLYSFYISGYPEVNKDVDTFGQKLRYAQIACGIAGLATSGAQFDKIRICFDLWIMIV